MPKRTARVDRDALYFAGEARVIRLWSGATSWSGWVDQMVDGVPVLGYVSEVPGLVLAAGFWIMIKT